MSLIRSGYAIRRYLSRMTNSWTRAVDERDERLGKPERAPYAEVEVAIKRLNVSYGEPGDITRFPIKFSLFMAIYYIRV